jgi:hypothetical protein
MSKGEVLLPEKYLEVGLTSDGREVIINHPVDPETTRLGSGHLVFSPAQARHLARLLLRKADECEPSPDREGET